jgi:hypothetical protein
MIEALAAGPGAEADSLSAPGLLRALRERKAVEDRAAADAVRSCSDVVNAHLDHEERDVEPLVLRLEDDPEWKALAKKLRPASIVDAANALAWMQDGAGERERSSLRATIPGPVVSLLTRLLARRYNREVAPVWR